MSEIRRVVRSPLAIVPVAMSLAAIGVVVVQLLFGVPQPDPHDEGLAARTWQLLIAAQLPLVAAFALRWLPEAPRAAVAVLAVQAAAGLVAVVPVLVLGW